MQPHYSQSNRENATPSSDTSLLASCKGIPPPPGFFCPQGGRYKEVEPYVVSSWYLRSSSWSVTPRATRVMVMTVPVFRAVTWTVTPRATNLRDIDKHSISSIFGPDLNSDSLVTGQVVLIMTSPGHMQYNVTQFRKSRFNWVRETFFRNCQSQRTFWLILLSTIVILILMQKISFQ